MCLGKDSLRAQTETCCVCCLEVLIIRILLRRSLCFSDLWFSEIPKICLAGLNGSSCQVRTIPRGICEWFFDGFRCMWWRVIHQIFAALCTGALPPMFSEQPGHFATSSALLQRHGACVGARIVCCREVWNSSWKTRA